MRNPNTVRAVMNGDAKFHVKACRAESLLDELPDGSASLIVTDPPYFKVKDEEWDRAWKKPADFLAWLGGIFGKFRRVLAPNGSLYVFASPQMAWGVEGEVRKRFEVLNTITWSKPLGRAAAARKEDFRAYFPDSERIIFAEHFGSDSTDPKSPGYDAKCDELRAVTFRPIIEYLESERVRFGMDAAHIDEVWRQDRGNNGGMSSHWFTGSQWMMPTRQHYNWLRTLFNRDGGAFLREDYDDLRAQYAILRDGFYAACKDIEHLRRPFAVSKEVPHADVWTYPVIQRYAGKHSCEKPWQMGLDIVRASSRPGDIVLDCFAGSGCFPAAAVALGRRAIACDMSPEWANVTRDRCQRALENPESAGSNRIARVAS